MPSVAIQGKLYHKIGPLEHDPDNPQWPRSFAQLYVHDPALDEASANDDEFQARAGNLKWPSNTSRLEKDRVLALLRSLQTMMRTENTYARDFIAAAELFATDDVENATLVISRDARPSDAHARQYDPASGGARRTFQEVTVLVGEGHMETGCIQLRHRNGTIWDIDFSNRAHDPLHFVLLFPQPTL